ncbi:hypothetical protein ACIPSJ_26935 [Streptomyces sp. NPDC090088]|uniref:hypothetical protein n=1 Tax=Streptomyces sp. NPDC090088 TaxID=3365944 RepID=UPI003808D0CD
MMTIVVSVLFARSTRSTFPSDGSTSSLITHYLAGAAIASGVIVTPPAVLALTTYVLAPSLRHLFERLLLYPLFGAAALVFLFLAVTTWKPGPGTPTSNMDTAASLVNAAAASALATSGIIVTTTGILASNFWLTLYFDARRCHPYDHIVLFLLGTAAHIRRERHRWHDDNQVTIWRASLEVVAVQVERDAPLSGRTGLAEGSAYMELRQEARRIAAVIRSHKRDLAEAYSAHDVDAVVASLVVGLRAFCVGDRTALLAHAPAEVAPRVGRFARTALRLIPATVLIVAGILLPLVPSIAHSELASNLRWYLIVMGTITFITTREDLATKIGEAVAKVLLK